MIKNANVYDMSHIKLKKGVQLCHIWTKKKSLRYRRGNQKP